MKIIWALIVGAIAIFLVHLAATPPKPPTREILEDRCAAAIRKYNVDRETYMLSFKLCMAGTFPEITR
jgi:hypothetical protein